MIDVTRRGGKRGMRSGARRDGNTMVMGLRNMDRRSTVTVDSMHKKVTELHLLGSTELHLLGSTEVRRAPSAFDYIHIPLLILAAKSHKVYHAYISPVLSFEGHEGFSDLACLFASSACSNIIILLRVCDLIYGIV